MSPQSISSWSMDVVVIYVSENSGKIRTDKRNDWSEIYNHSIHVKLKTEKQITFRACLFILLIQSRFVLEYINAL